MPAMKAHTKFFCLWLASNGVLGRKPPDNTDFKTEPSFELVNFNIKIFPDDVSVLAPGYVFLANDMGPQIYDIYGELIWYMDGGNDYKHQDFHPCDYLGDQGTHLCWHITSLLEGHQNTADDSKNVIYDNNYNQVGHNYSRGIDGTSPNLHGFHMLPYGRTFLQPVYVTRDRDLRAFKGPKNGAIWDSCFQEMDVATDKEVFRWCPTEHFQIWETSVFFTREGTTPPPGQRNATSRKAGRGNHEFPFDFFHTNAIAKNSESDYLVSSRHFDQIIKVAGLENRQGLKPGSIIWRLGGYGNDFKMKDFSFHKQHAVRYVSTGSTETVLSLFDNEWEGSEKKEGKYSAGQIIKVNNGTMEAELLNEYKHPNDGISGSQGDMQLLPNGNAFIGWGRIPELSEFDHNGTCVYHASFRTRQYNPNSYRAFKDSWIGNPLTPPKLLAYAKDCSKSSPLVAYVSWNGATEVDSWHFYVATQENGPWISAGKAAKDGFETEYVLSRKKWLSPFMPYVAVEARDSHGAMLSSTTTKTWVPGRKIRSDCDKKGCFHGKHFAYQQRMSHARKCEKRDVPAIIALAILVLFVEALSYASRTLSIWIFDKLKHRMVEGNLENGDHILLAKAGPGGKEFRDDD